MFMVGDRVIVIWGKKSKSGEMIYQNDCFMTVQLEHYKESFLKIDISNGTV